MDHLSNFRMMSSIDFYSSVMHKPLHWLYSKISNQIIKIAMLVVLQSFLSFLSVIYAIFFRYLLDSASNESGSMIREYSIAFLSLLLVQCLLNTFYKHQKEMTTVTIENRLKESTIRNIYCHDYSYVSAVHSGDWMNKIFNDVSVVARNAVNLLPNLAGIIIHIITAMIILIRLIPGFMTIIFLMISGALVFELVYSKKIKSLHKVVQEKDGELRVFVQEQLKSLMVIKSYSKEKWSLRQLFSYLDEYRNARRRKSLFSVIMNFFFGTGLNGVLILSAVYCAFGVFEHKLSYGTFVAVVQIVTQLRSPVAGAYSSIPNYFSMIGSIERLMQVENYKKETEFSESAVPDFDEIQIDHVFFSYQKDLEDMRYFMEDLTFTIKKGSFIGISGPSGCGKSTLFKLLLNLYEPNKGDIRVLRNNTECLLGNERRKLFAYVPQDNQLMKGTIRQIICFGLDYDAKKMDSVLKISCCDEFVSLLPEGIETELKESGSGLSQGQMQRIAIARALYSDRQILLLDEVTSALNEDLEITVLNNLRSLSDKTVLFITHRKKAFKFVDIQLKCEEREGGLVWSAI